MPITSFLRGQAFDAEAVEAQANRHVVDGRRVVERQRALIARQKARGHDTQQSEGLLAQFERSQEMFESDLAASAEHAKHSFSHLRSPQPLHRFRSWPLYL
jgi:hypothetical protein